MNAITAKDGTQIYYKDWGTGRPIALGIVPLIKSRKAELLPELRTSVTIQTSTNR